MFGYNAYEGREGNCVCLTQIEPYKVWYPTHDPNLDALVFCFKTWKHYLYGEQFKLFTNHKNMKYPKTRQDLNMCQEYWMEIWEQYDFNLAYHPDKANVVA